jgi:hypothetical protein
MRFENITSVGVRHVRFDIQDLDLSLVNSLRRTIIADVPTACFVPDNKHCLAAGADDAITPASTVNPETWTRPYAPPTIEIVRNTSVHNNEFVADRVGLVPIHFDETELLDIIDNKVQWRFTLKARNGSGTVSKDVTSNDFVGTRDGAPLTQGDLSRLFPPDPFTGHHILILTLRPPSLDYPDGEDIELVCRPWIGTGSEDARWTPTSKCTFGFRVDERAAEVALDELLQAAVAANATETEMQQLRHDFQVVGRQRCFSRSVKGGGGPQG